MAVWLQYFFESRERRLIFGELSFERRARRGGKILLQSFLVLGNNLFSVLETPFDDTSVAHTHGHVEIHLGAIDEAGDAA